jgi:hypothetical protein
MSAVSHTGWYLAVAMSLTLGGCAHHSQYPPDEVARPATDMPTRFVYDATDYSPDSIPMGVCRTPMADPRDRARLIMVRIVPGRRADYEVPPGRYGVKSGELLRINCLTSAAIGIVPR